MPINCVHACDFLGISLSSSRTTDNVIKKPVMKFNMKSIEVISDFKLLPCYIKSKLFTTFCTDAYGCQLWNFESREVHNLYVAWRKVVCKLWRLPYITHCNLLHTFNNSLPIHPQWYESYNYVHHSIMDKISLNCTDHNYGLLIRDLCHYRDSCDPHGLTATEIVQLIEYLCTI